MKTALVFEARRDGYGIDQIRNAMTVGELRELLDGLDDDVMIICSHDNGYTYGSLSHEATIREERGGDYGPMYIETDVIRAW